MSEKHQKWLEWLEKEQRQPYFQRYLEAEKEIEKNFILTPEKDSCFYSLSFSEIESVKVILTDSHTRVGAYGADGLAWSTLGEADKTLQWLYKKIYKDLGIIYNQEDNSKEHWKQQGVLLLNMELRGVLNKPRGRWVDFTKNVVRYFLEDNQPRAFILFDQYTKTMKNIYDNKHLVLVDNIFTVQRDIFKAVNNFIYQHYGVEINWGNLT